MILTPFAIGLLVCLFISCLAFFLKVQKLNKQKLELLNNYELLYKVVGNSKDLLYYYQVKPFRQFIYLSPSTDTLLGKGTVDAAYADPDHCYKMIHPDDYDILDKKIHGRLDYTGTITQRWKNKDGIYHWYEEYTTPIYENGELVAIQGVIRCIDEQIKLKQQLEYRVTHDYLTGIYNREYFERKFTEYNEKIDVPVGVILCDLDELKCLNDQCGHKRGDALIKAAATVLNIFLSETITVARIGGDEFALLVANTSELELSSLIDAITKELNNHNQSNYLHIKLSIGHAFSKHSSGKMQELFVKADQKMYKDKNRKKALCV